MHRCLRITEILHEICEYLAVVDMGMTKQPAVRSRKATAALASLARTCKAIQDPALDVLWADLDYFMRLIQCLPRSLWKVNALPPTAPHLVQPEQPVIFQRAMTLLDWKVFNKYAHRVRSLGGMAEENNQYAVTITISSEVLLALSCPPTSSPLLPNLRSLTWNTLSPDCTPLFRLLLSPKITRLIFRLESARLDCYANSALSVIGSVCPQISYFVLGRTKHARETEESVSVLSQLVESLQHLRTLEVNAISGKAIAHLASLPSLTSVCFAIDSSFVPYSIKSALPPQPFPMLNTLTIRAPGIIFVDALMRLMKISPTLIDVCAETNSEATRISRFFATLSNSCCTESLKTLRVQEHPTSLLADIPDPNKWVLGVQDLRPLFRFTRLRAVRLELVSTFDIDNAAIEELAHAWPELTSLHINKDVGWKALSKITYHGLLTLLENCSKLSSLSIDIDLRSLEEMPVPRACPCNGLSNKLIREMSLGNSRIDKPANVAVFMSAVLPNLMKVNAWSTRWADRRSDEARESYKVKWEMFNQFLPIFAATRAQGKGCPHATRFGGIVNAEIGDAKIKTELLI
ncbi:hypothetical protein BJ138DRAFT_1117553 [Hygrophoropsis aurantiaca]|uniref:Uncharacterized protein n=1 Tax=Hygrophoropsis aurantiaca TaxID=72124 RepID=A0ACB8A031_9AGAM|nr:hypothetical protein BJ138DRAFT_1117553 [Hygrophoropsis aurantiaca]